MGTGTAKPLWGGLAAGLLSLLLATVGCGDPRGPDARAAEQRARPQVLVVAPVINLSGGTNFDPLQVTDMLASECLSFRGVAVIPVNLTLAALARQGKVAVETPEDALALAREFGADATLVAAITEYDPYDPPIVGLVLQWYAAQRPESAVGLDPVSASREAMGPGRPEAVAAVESGPRWQVQRVYNAADKSILEEVRTFASRREGHASPYAWRKYVKSQELYVRYCCWAAIRTMLRESRGYEAVAATDRAKR